MSSSKNNLDAVLSKNKSLNHIHKGKRCFIIGNGPSIKLQDLSPLQDEVSIVVSSFYRHPDAKKINPAYWLMADPLIWENPEECFFPAFKCAFEMDVSPKLFVPTGGFPFFADLNTGPLIDLHFYHYDAQKKIDTTIDFSTGIPPYGQNVVIVCLMLAFYLGCNPIYLLGCDHDFMNFTREEYDNGVVEHFYHTGTQNEDGFVMKWDQFRNAMLRMKYEYMQLKLYASVRGIHVFNATREGFLDIFPRAEYESLFPSRNRSIDSNKILSTIPDIASVLGQSAIKLINGGNFES